MNRVHLMGNLGQDPEIRHTSNGKTVASFSVATRGYKKDETDWHRCVAWEKTAEVLRDYFHKGSWITIEGRLQTRQWEDQEGQKRYTTEVVCDRIHFTGSKSTEGAPRQKKESYSPTGGKQGEELDDDIPF